MCNRKLLLNGNGFILGVSGSGKSFAAKMEILMSALFSNDDIIVIDVEREYGSLIRNLGGEVITLSASSKNHINALEINNDIDMDENPVSIKSEFLISLFDQLLKSNDSRLGGGVGAKDKSIIDRCAIKVYGDFLNGKSEYMPTLVDFRNELLRQPEDEAQDLALSLEIFTTGSLDAFAHQSDVNTNNRIVAYDILELGEQMKSIGLLIMLDNIFNRVMANRRRGKYTRVYVDEAHLYFKNPYSADFLLKCWKRFRKYGGLLTGITQNISDCLLNETARGMLSNSEFLLLLNQAPSDRKDLSELLSISDTQMSYITNAGAGRGLIKVGGSIVPFINEFPTDTELYKLMSHKTRRGLIKNITLNTAEFLIGDSAVESFKEDTMKNKMTEKLFELAYTDSMTEVQNRNAYEERLKKLRKPNANISRITVIVVDVNGLKEINDSYGHFCGDDAIKTVAKALRDTIGIKADIYRIGGDEFVCISESNVLPYISQFKDTIYFINNEKLYNLSVSIGYSRFHEKYSKSIDDIICRADEKMYKDKKSKK